MSPAQIVRFARNHNKLRIVDQKHDIAMAWLNAAWQRAKRMPSLKKATEITAKKSRVTLADVMSKVNSVKKVDE